MSCPLAVWWFVCPVLLVALAPWTICGLMDVCGLGSPGRGLRTAVGAVGSCSCSRSDCSGHEESVRALLAAASPTVVVCNHAVPGTDPATVCGQQDRSLLL